MQLYSQPPRTAFMPVAIPDDVPVYRIKDGKFYADDELFEAGSIIAWDEEPNMEMEPLNPIARERMIKYMQKLDKYGREVAEKNGKAFISIEDAFNQSAILAKSEGRRVSLLNGTQEVPIMGGGKRKGKAKARKIDNVTPVDVITEKAANTSKAVNDAVANKF